MIKNKRLFLFLIPTLIVALVIISLNQQNIFITADDSDSDSGIIQTKTPTKHLNYKNIPLTSCILNEGDGAPVSIINGNAPIFALLLNYDNNPYNIKNHSPPINIAV